MPTIHLNGSPLGENVSEKNLLIFLTLCARHGCTEVIYAGDDWCKHFYAVRDNLVVGLSAYAEVVKVIGDKLEAAGLAILPAEGPVSIGADDLLERLNHHAQEITRVAGDQHLVECHACGRAFEDGKFCPYCGKPAGANLRRCPGCEECYPPAFSFCPRCGKTLAPTEHWVYDYAEPEEFFYGGCIRDAKEGGEESDAAPDKKGNVSAS